jgi:hypothetical protein
MSTFPILEWDPEWNDLTDSKRFCPTEPRWIAKEKITAPFMMGVATDLCTQKSIMAKHDPELDELVEYKIY